MKLGFKPNIVIEGAFILAAALIAWVLDLPAWGIILAIIGAYALVFFYETALDNRRQRERSELRRSRRQANNELYGWPDLSATPGPTGSSSRIDVSKAERTPAQPTLERLAAEKPQPAPAAETEAEEAIVASLEPPIEPELAIETEPELQPERELETAAQSALLEQPVASEPEPVLVEEAAVEIEPAPEPSEPERREIPERQVAPEPAISPERELAATGAAREGSGQGSRLAVIANRADITGAGEEQAIGGWNVWELERLLASRKGKDDERDYERQLLLVYLRDFASSDGRLPPELDDLVREAFGDLVRGPSGR